MTNVTFAELTRAASDAGFSSSDAATAAAIALAESGGDPRAVSPTNTNGTKDYGAWQINSVHAKVLASGDRFNVNDNARMAYAVFQGQGFNAWTTYKNGAYKQFLTTAQNVSAVTPEAETVAKRDGLGGKVADLFGNVTGIDALTATVGKYANLYVGAMLALVLFVVAAVILSRNTAAAKAAKNGAALAIPGPSGKVKAVAAVAKGLTS